MTPTAASDQPFSSGPQPNLKVVYSTQLVYSTNCASPLQATTATSRPTPFSWASPRSEPSGLAVLQVNGAPALGRQRLGQHEIAVEQIDQRKAAGDEERKLQIDRAQQAAHHRPDDEAQAEHRAQHAEALGALFGRR